MFNLKNPTKLDLQNGFSGQIKILIIQMESLCDRVLRCLCFCLIKKETVSYTEANDEQNKFISLNDHFEQQTRQNQKLESNSTELSGKFKNYLDQDVGKQNKQEKVAQLKSLNLSNQISQEDQEKLLKPQQIFVKDYSDIMSVNHPYYQLFQEKLLRLPHIFDLPQDNNPSQPYTDYELKMHCYPSGKFNVFVYFFKLPTDFETYDNLLDDFQLQKSLDLNIDQYKKEHEIVGENTKVLYLAYKKVLIISARDFYYVKYSFSKYNEHWSICTSDLSYQEKKNKVRGEMLLTATRILEVDGHIEVSVYSLIDMKMNLKMDLAKNRGYSEIKKYLDKVYKHITKESSKEEFDI